MSASVALPNPGSRIIEQADSGYQPGGGVGNLVISVASAADAITPWGSAPRGRDQQLRAFWPTEPYFASGLFTTVAQYAAFPYSLEGPPRMVRVAQNMLSAVEFGGGWEALITPFLTDMFTQDNGAFMEIVRTDDEPGAPVVSLNHLDSCQCRRTGQKDTPVVYTDSRGREHTLKWYNVVAYSEMPSPVESMYGVGYSVLTRVLRSAQIMRDISIVKQEKASGRFTRQVHLVGGVQTRIIEDAMAQKQNEASAAGFLRYIQPLIVASLDPTSRVTKETIDLASVPDDWDEQKSMEAYITLMAMAFGGDYQNFAPLPGGGLGSSSQSKVLNMKSRGKGPGLFMRRIERLFNFHGLLPRTVTFKYGEQDIAQQIEHTELSRSVALELEILIRAGVITTEVARQMYVDKGLMDERYLVMMREENATENIIGSDTVPAEEVDSSDVKPGKPGPDGPPQAAQGGQPGGANQPANTNAEKPKPPATNQGRTPGGTSGR